MEEPEQPELNTISLRDHFQAVLDYRRQLEEQRIDSLRREMDLLTSTAATAIRRAEEANDKRFAALAQVHDAQYEALRREVAELAIKVSRVGE
jgi:hypothetical protein